MTRIYVNSRDPESGEPTIEGWFDSDDARTWDERTRWDGQNRVPLATGVHTEHQRLMRTAEGRWLINAWSQWQGVQETYSYISGAAARKWLMVNEYTAEEIADAGLGATPVEAGPDVGADANANWRFTICTDVELTREEHDRVQEAIGQSSIPEALAEVIYAVVGNREPKDG